MRILHAASKNGTSRIDCHTCGTDTQAIPAYRAIIHIGAQLLRRLRGFQREGDKPEARQPGRSRKQNQARKKLCRNGRAFCVCSASDRASDLAGTEAPCTNVDMARSTIDNSLDPANIRLPSSVGTAVGVGHLDTKAYALAANIALCHFPAPPYFRRYVTHIIISYFAAKCKHNLSKKLQGYILGKM